jgi:hypothetical protein
VLLHTIKYGLKLHPESFLIDRFLAKTIYHPDCEAGCTYKMFIPQYLLSVPLIYSLFVFNLALVGGCLKRKTASPKAIPSIFTHKLFRRADFKFLSAHRGYLNIKTRKAQVAYLNFLYIFESFFPRN